MTDRRVKMDPEGESDSPVRSDLIRPDKIKVAIVAQALAVRLGLRAILQAAETIEVSGEAVSLPLVEVNLEQVDVLLVVGAETRLEGLAEIQQPPAVLLMTENPQAVQGLWDHPNAWGVLSLDASAEELEAAVLALSRGLWVGDPYLFRQGLANQALTVQPAGMAAVLPGGEGLPNGQMLTSRELEVLQGLSQGLANKQIGLALGISEHTVKFHVSAIYTKLRASNRTEAVRFGVQQGLVTL